MKANSNLVPTLSQANFLGQGVDITGKARIPDNLIQPLLDPLKTGTIPFFFLGKEFAIPAYVLAAEDTAGVYFEDTVETRQALQDSFSANVGVEASYGAFSGQMEAAYGRQFSQSSDFSYSYRNFHARLAHLSLNMGEAMRALSDTFVAGYQALPDQVTDENLQQFADFFDQFGFYVAAQIGLGATLEYYVAVQKQSQLSLESISASVKAEYKGLFFSGGVSADIANTQEFQSYASNRTVNILAQGGDPSLIAKLGNVDPGNASMDSVTLYNQWADSIDADPAVADFGLTGIWELIPDTMKSAAVAQAFAKLRDTMRPRLVMSTSSRENEAPVITLGSLIQPAEPLPGLSGFQMVILDRSKISPAGVLFDKYYGVPDGSSGDYYEYERMYDAMVADIRNNGFDDTRHVLILASYGMSSNAPPNAGMYALLREAGAGSALQAWVDLADPGSSMWLWPGSYILVGTLALGPETGVELLSQDPQSQNQIKQEVFFYRQRGDSLYTLSAGPSRVGAAQGEVASQRRAYRVRGKGQVFVAAITSTAA